MLRQARRLRVLARYPITRFAAGMALANGIGAIVVFVLLRFVLPLPGKDQLAVLSTPNYVVYGLYMPVALALGAAGSWRVGRPVRHWLARGGAPTADEYRAALRQPIRQVGVFIALWLIGILLFSLVNLSGGQDLVLTIVITIGLGGAAACSIAYVVTERALRPITARAMAARLPSGGTAPGITVRILFLWALSTAIPVVGIGLIALAKVTGAVLPVSGQIGPAVLMLAALTLIVGLIGMTIVARSISDPVLQVVRAMEKVELGRLDTSVSVYDGSEIGQLQSGFNRMVRGLAEREHLRDLFERHVGQDVVRRAVADGSSLGGSVCDVAVLFVDIIGSTRLAETRPATEVVDLLNEFFRIVVDVVAEHGGFVNKFEGDAALAIFGAPDEIDDAPSRALAAARDLRSRIDTFGILDVGIGVSAGPAVAGNIGAAARFEYTVIGDPVNEAARLTELAKRRRPRVLSSERTIDLASADEAAQWRLGERVTLRGRSARTRLAEPLERVHDGRSARRWAFISG